MKKVLMYATLLLFAGCTSPKGENAEAGDKQSVKDGEGIPYLLDSTSIVHWAASKPGTTHHGTFQFKDGMFKVNNNVLTGGNFTIDITTLKNTDLSEKDGKAKLEGHLKSPDFFNISKFPTAKFEITGIKPTVNDADSLLKNEKVPMTGYVLISGNLTLMDSTKNISFPARVTIDANSLSAKADFNIDRTRWGLNYKGPGNPQDWFISKEVNLKLDLSASRK